MPPPPPTYDKMKLRDWFAGQLAARFSTNRRVWHLLKMRATKNATTVEQEIAKEAYRYADAMVVESEL